MVRKKRSENLEEELRFDKQGRMLYHPAYHPNIGRRYTEDELEYICKFCHHDDLQSLAFAIGKPEATVGNMLTHLRKSGKFSYYKRLDKYYV